MGTKEEIISIWREKQQTIVSIHAVLQEQGESATEQALWEEAAAATLALFFSLSFLFGFLVLICLLCGAALEREGESSSIGCDCFCLVSVRNVYLKQETRYAEQDSALYPA